METQSAVIPVTTTDAYDLLQKATNNLIVIDFDAQWCVPCKRIAPWLDQLSIQFISFLKIDVEEGDELAEQFEISAIPTFKFVKNQKVLEEHTIKGTNQQKIQQTILFLM